MKQRVALSLLLALPVAIISFAMADRPTAPQLIKWALSPGYMLAMSLLTGGTLAQTLSNFCWIALTVNDSYYGALIFLAICWWQGSQNSK